MYYVHLSARSVRLGQWFCSTRALPEAKAQSFGGEPSPLDREAGIPKRTKQRRRIADQPRHPRSGFYPPARRTTYPGPLTRPGRSPNLRGAYWGGPGEQAGPRSACMWTGRPASGRGGTERGHGRGRRVWPSSAALDGDCRVTAPSEPEASPSPGK